MPDELKNYEFPFSSLFKLFEKMDDKEKLEFARNIKTGWNNELKIVYQDIIRIFYKKLALESKDFNEVMFYRYSLLMFQEFEKNILSFSAYFDEKIKKMTTTSNIEKI